MLLILFVTVILIVFILLFTIWSYSTLSRGICKFSGNLTGKVVIITGANSGIGLETAKDLAQRGAFIIAACRNLKKGQEAVTEIIKSSGNQDVYLKKIDLASFASIRGFVDDVLKLVTHVDILINNAGLHTRQNEKTEDGYKIGMQVNYLGPFLLTQLLLPILKKSNSSRIINVSSIVYIIGEKNLDYFDKDSNVNTILAYPTSKLFMILMTKELARQLKDTKVTVNCLHPGLVYTKLIADIDFFVLRIYFYLIKTFCKTAQEGAQTTIYLSVSPEVTNISGSYFEDCREVKLLSKATDLNMAKKLWIASEKCVLNV